MRAQTDIRSHVVARSWHGEVFHGREKIYVSPGAVPDACLVLDSPYWLVQVGEGLAAVLGTVRVRERIGRMPARTGAAWIVRS
jgi:hypothetical protein